MRVLIGFVIGVLVGAGGLFAWLHQMPGERAAQEASVRTGSLPPPGPGSANPQAAAPAPAPAPAAGVPLDLSDFDLPLRPGVGDPAAAPAATTSPGNAPASVDTRLGMPVEGVRYDQISDTFDQARGSGRRHEALDIMAPRGTRVVAAGDGKVVKLFTSKPGGLTVYQFDPSEKYAYYYAHLDRYADGLQEGAQLHKGDLIGYVGSTGDADPNAPHLHFAVFELTPEKQWWKGTPVDPYPLMKP